MNPVLEERFWAKVDPGDWSGCWLWTAAGHTRTDHGMIGFEGKTFYAHKLLYEDCVGPVPDGLVLDHIVCDTPRCVNPDHLEPTTIKVNVLRGNGPTAVNARKTHCDNGHPLVTVAKRGDRGCTVCP